MAITVVTPPAEKALSVAAVKPHLNIETNEIDWDTELEDIYIPSAVWNFETFTNRALITQSVKQTFDQFPSEDFFNLERYPASSIDSIQYYNLENTLITFDPSNYIFVSTATPQKVCLAYGKNWPTDIHPTRMMSVEVNYSAGEANNENTLYLAHPEFKAPLCMLVAYLYKNREDDEFGPGISKIQPEWTSTRLMLRLKTYFYQHRSQTRVITSDLYSLGGANVRTSY